MAYPPRTWSQENMDRKHVRVASVKNINTNIERHSRPTYYMC